MRALNGVRDRPALALVHSPAGRGGRGLELRRGHATIRLPPAPDHRAPRAAGWVSTLDYGSGRRFTVRCTQLD